MKLSRWIVVLFAAVLAMPMAADDADPRPTGRSIQTPAAAATARHTTPGSYRGFPQ